MRRTIAQRRTSIGDALRTHLPETGAFDRSSKELLEFGRPRLRGQVFLAMADGLGDERPLEALVPIAASLELVSLQTRLHRSAVEDARRTGVKPTDDVLLGDLLESTAFELTAGFDAEPALVESCLEALAEATRTVQEGQATLTAAEPESAALDGEDARRIGALTGCAVELATLLADVEPRRELARRGSILGYRLLSHRPESRLPSDRRLPADRSQWLEPIVECCPSTSRTAVRTQLSAVLEATLDRESTDPIT